MWYNCGMGVESDPTGQASPQTRFLTTPQQQSRTQGIQSPVLALPRGAGATAHCEVPGPGVGPVVLTPEQGGRGRRHRWWQAP